MAVILVVKKGPARTRSVRLTTRETIIGRSRDCDLCIPSADISRRHCLITHADGKITIEDLSSANGTFLNGRPVSGIQRVQGGDQLQIGPLTFAVELQPTKSVMKALNGSPPGPSQPVEAPGFELLDVVPEDDDDAIPLAPLAKEDEEEPLDVILADEDAMDLGKGNDFRDILGKLDP
jgi:pSer/pThr/pTyr-binding forkhead associated (FHA) protein